MKRVPEQTIHTLRDAVIRRRAGLPLPTGIDVDELLEEAAETIEQLQKRIDYLAHYADR